MANLGFTRRDLDDLAQKVSTLAPDLNEQERALLLAIFAAAAERAETFNHPYHGASLPVAEVSGPAGDARPADPLTAEILRQQLLGAYVPGQDFDSLFCPGKITPDKPGSIDPDDQP